MNKIKEYLIQDINNLSPHEIRKLYAYVRTHLIANIPGLQDPLERSYNNDYETSPKLPSFEGEKEMYLGQARYPTWTYVKWLEKQLGNFS